MKCRRLTCPPAAAELDRGQGAQPGLDLVTIRVAPGRELLRQIPKPLRIGGVAATVPDMVKDRFGDVPVRQTIVVATGNREPEQGQRVERMAPTSSSHTRSTSAH